MERDAPIAELTWSVFPHKTELTRNKVTVVLINLDQQKNKKPMPVPTWQK
jgi:hypothetical protein